VTVVVSAAVRMARPCTRKRGQWSHGTTGRVMSALEFMQRQAAQASRLHPATSSAVVCR
jgi:hypothetical protein